MLAQMKFVHDRHSFEQIWRLNQALLNTTQRLPAQVFRPELSNFRFADFNWALSASFSEALDDLIKISGDSAFSATVIDPDPVSYFHHHFGYFGAFTLAKEAGPDEYWDAVRFAPA